MSSVTIPNRSVFRTQEVCEIAEVQPYVLRSWESEFPDLGMAKGADGPRVYRRSDVQRVLRLKHLLFVDGLTLAGARKQLILEGAAPAERAPADEVDDEVTDADVAKLLDKRTRDKMRDVRHGLQWILGVLNGGAPKPARRRATKKKPLKKAVTKTKRVARPSAKSKKPKGKEKK